MNSLNKKVLIFFLPFLLFLSSCEKTEGLGGTSEIKGKVYAIDYNSDMTIILNEFYAPAEDVYIIYGDDEVYNDKFETHYDGSYRFKYLKKGKYKIFAYSKTFSGITHVIKEVEITESNQVIELDNIVIYK